MINQLNRKSLHFMFVCDRKYDICVFVNCNKKTYILNESYQGYDFEQIKFDIYTFH